MTKSTAPVHPGEILKQEFLDEMGISVGRLASHIYVPRTRIERLFMGQTAMTLDTARRLSKAFGMTVEFWITSTWGSILLPQCQNLKWPTLSHFQLDELHRPNDRHSVDFPTRNLR